MNVLFLFTYGVTLKQWHDIGIISREIALYKNLSKKNVNFKFLTYGDQTDIDLSHKFKEINVLAIKKHITSRNPKFQLIKSLLLPLKLKDELRGIDIIKTNQLSGSWISWIAKLLFRKKLIVRGGYEKLNRPILNQGKKGVLNYLKNLINYFFIFIYELISYKLADGIILSNKKDISFIIKVFKLKNKFKQKRICLFSNPINTDLFRPMDCPKKDKHILFIGRLEWEKNLFMLLDAIKNLKEFTLDIIGNGSYLEKLKEKVRIQEISVNFKGRIPNDDLPNIINKYQIFIIPSIFEGNPKVLLEAMSCGLSCIGSNIQGINNLIKHKENGFLCDLSVESIQNAINYIYNNEPLNRKMGVKAREYVYNNCSLRILTKKEYLFYKEVLKK